MGHFMAALLGVSAAFGCMGADWPTHGWPQGTPLGAGLDEKMLAGLDGDFAGGKYQLVDSFQVFRCGREVFARKYVHDYAAIYGKEAKTKGPLNARLTGRYKRLPGIPEWQLRSLDDLQLPQLFTADWK
jgi:hypothetical protein